MTNREKYAGQILDIACNQSDTFGVLNGKPRGCYQMYCSECEFSKAEGRCGTRRKIWANSEYVESPVDWSKVAVDTPILARDSDTGIWYPRYFAKYENGVVYAWGSGSTSWSSGGDTISWKYAKLAEREDTDGACDCGARTEGYCPDTSRENDTMENIEKCKKRAIGAWNRRANDGN